MPYEVVDALRRAGIDSWIIFRVGRDLFHLIECVDYKSAMEAFLTDAAGERWQADMAQLLEPMEPSSEDRVRPPMEVIWSL